MNKEARSQGRHGGGGEGIWPPLYPSKSCSCPAYLFSTVISGAGVLVSSFLFSPEAPKREFSRLPGQKAKVLLWAPAPVFRTGVGKVPPSCKCRTTSYLTLASWVWVELDPNIWREPPWLPQCLRYMEVNQWALLRLITEPNYSWYMPRVLGGIKNINF